MIYLYFSINLYYDKRKEVCPMLDFRIDTFLTVCEYMNYTRAAEALCIT